MRAMVIGFLFASVTILLPAAGRGQTAPEGDTYFQQYVHYSMDVRLNTDQHSLTGSEKIAYTNNSPDTLRKFYLHLYPNAYKNKDTALLTDYRRAFNYTLLDLPKKYRGSLDIANVTVDGVAVTPRIDDTIAEMELPTPLPPGGTMEIALTFEETIRRHIGRAGYRGEHYDLSQWYPKVVVYDENGFHPDKFRTGEFYGEFGTFDVQIELPENYVVAATGVVESGDPGWTLNPASGAKSKDRTAAKAASGRDRPYKTVRFHAEKVHDFAWSADPTFVVQDSTWNDVHIHSFYRKADKAWHDTTLVHGVRAIEWLSRKVGLYPYPQVSVVDALLGGGMEYPMLVMDGRVGEGLVVHEVGHIYFYGIFGNDERAEAWLDEGFTTFQTSWYMISRYGKYGDAKNKWNWYQRLTPQYTLLGDMRRSVFPTLRLGYGERISTRAEDFKNSYRVHVYQKAALMLHALRYVVGDETFDKILHEYFVRWQFKHVNEARFKEVCESVSGMDLGWFFDPWLHSRKICDYDLAEVKTKASERGDAYTSDVRIERKGELVMPITLEFTFAGGTTQTARLDGRLRTIKKSFTFPEKPKRIALNPENEIADIDLSDNFLPRHRDFQIDWPNNDYYPEDAYQIRYRPEAWYNDIDGLKTGFHLRGSYANWRRRLTLGLYYGFKSGRVDFTTSYRRPIRIFGNNGHLAVSGYKMEGRQDFTFEFGYRKRKELIHPPSQDFTFGVNYHELANDRFVANKETYEKGAVVTPYFGYAVDPQLDVASTRIDATIRTGRKWFGGEYKYTSIALEAVAKTRPDVIPIPANLRVFLGIGGGGMPFQEKFQLAGGGPLAEEKRFFLRSPGAIWKDANYHEGGGGNLRGYNEGGFGVNRLLALNFELGTKVPFLSTRVDRALGAIKAMGFVDVGTILDKGNPIGTSNRVETLVASGILDQTLVDAGIGFNLARNLPFYDLFVRFEMPFYVNHPEVNGETDKTKSRYLFSLNSAF